MIFVVGARPNLMKVAPLIREVAKYSRKFAWKLLHTGQHYDRKMSGILFDDLALPKPDIYLGVGSGTHAKQTGKIMYEFEKVCSEKRPDLIVVVGDVNSTLACALAAAKLCIPLAHVEAGLRSFDKMMPEEINRVITDHLSDYLFTTCEDANENLINEGIERDKIFFVGNTMIDSLLSHIERAKDSLILGKLGLKKYGLVTLHRPSNVDNPEILKRILDALEKLNRIIPLVFLIHPRTQKQMKGRKLKGVITMPPLGYLDFLSLMSTAEIVLTDSGGIQEETTVLGVPCLTLLDNTERSITVKAGTNFLVGNNPAVILKIAANVLGVKFKRKKILYWDDKVAMRIMEVLDTQRDNKKWRKQ